MSMRGSTGFYHTTMEPFYKKSTVGLKIRKQNKIDTTPKSRHINTLIDDHANES